MKRDPAYKAFKLVQLFQTSKCGLTVWNVKNELGVSKQHAQRLINTMSTVFPIIEDGARKDDKVFGKDATIYRLVG